MREVAKLLTRFVWIVVLSSLPATAYAQATISGVVKDASGAVLPGVTVEAASPVLIEKVRSAATDGTGQYQIPALPPGTYAVTYTLPGFNTVTREGLALAGAFAAKIDIELRVGAVEETITVTGQSPLVDVQNTRRQRVIDREIIDTIPSARTAYEMASLIPGVSRGALTTQDVGGSASGANPIGNVAIHGGRSLDQMVTRNGIETTGQSANGNSTPININPVGTQELNVDTASLGAEFPSGGVRMNIIPREGGNTFNGAFYTSYANQSWQSNNLTQALKAQGVSSADKLKENYDINPGFGGPLKESKVWFFLAARYKKTASYASQMYYDKNFNNPNVWVFEPDLTRPAVNPNTWKGASLRLTWQASARIKVGANLNEDTIAYNPAGVNQTLAPEAAENRLYPVQQQRQVDFSSPVNNRVLLEGGINHYKAASNLLPMSGLSPVMIPTTEQSTGLKYRSLETHRLQPALTTHMRFAMSYVTGAHSAKVGTNLTRGWNGFQYQNLNPLSYRLNNGVPNQISERAFPIVTDTNVQQIGVYAQDKWTIARLTAQLGGRYSRIVGSTPAQHVGPSVLTPSRDVNFTPVEFMTWNDLTPYMSAVYDLFGNGKTALKVSMNKYLESLSAGSDISLDGNPAQTIISQTTRSWNDANRNYVPDCNLQSPLANGECGAMASASFGQTAPGKTYDQKLMHGWGKRAYNWEFTSGIQHELMARTSIDVTYYRRMFGNFRVSDNRAVAASDFDKFDVTAPLDPRLPGGGGYIVHGMYNLNPAKFGASDNFITSADNYGGQTEYWHGVDVNVTMRRIPGLTLQGGTSTGRTVQDECALRAQVPEPVETRATSGLLTTGNILPLEFCHRATNWLTQMKWLGSYTIPRIDVLVSGTMQNLPGPPIAANYNLPSAVAAQALGRPLSGGAANVVVGLISAGSQYGDRLSQVDFRVAKILRVARTKTMMSVDFFNLTNASTVLANNATFGTSWLRPSAILPARFAKVTLQVDF